MKYSDKREFAARVFAAVLAVRFPAFMGYTQPDEQPWVKIIALLAQAQLDALPEAYEAEIDAIDPYHGDCDADLDAAYALAVKLAPLVGIEVPA